MINIKNTFILQIFLQKILVILPCLGLLIAAIQWLRFGIDMPLGDDWGTYIDGNMRSFKLSYLFAHGNDTLYPVGKVLDSLAYRLLNGNTIAYQFISMVLVLGALLVVQWHLLVFAIKDKLLATSAFSLTLLMVQPNTYWGWQNLAYHQALPLVFCLTALYLVLTSQWRKFALFGFCFMLGLLSGFSYISGAFAALVMGLALLVAYGVQREPYMLQKQQKNLLFGGGGLFLAGMISTAAQVWVITGIQKGTHIPGLRMAMPWESDFWLFMMGKIARSLMLSSEQLLTSLLITGFIFIICIFFGFKALQYVVTNNPKENSKSVASIIFLALGSVIFVYLALVCAERTYLRPAEDTAALKVFYWGFHRIHFFWVTLLWPWLAAMVFLYANEYKKLLAWGIPLIILPWAIYAGAYKHAAFFKITQDIRAGGFQCLQEAMRTDAEVNCWQLLPHPLRKGVENGQKTGASYARLLPLSTK